MPTMRLWLMVVAVGLLLVPGIAGAVVLDLSVSGAEGPVTLNLTEVDGTTRQVTTDASGRATVEVKPGLVKVAPADDRYVRDPRTLIVPPTGSAVAWRNPAS